MELFNLCDCWVKKDGFQHMKRAGINYEKMTLRNKYRPLVCAVKIIDMHDSTHTNANSYATDALES